MPLDLGLGCTWEPKLSHNLTHRDAFSEGFQLREGVEDRRAWELDSLGLFSVKSFFVFLFLFLIDDSVPNFDFL